MTAGEPLRVLRAAWAAPMSGPAIANAAVAHRAGRILAVGAWPEVSRDTTGAMVDDAGDAVICPGLVNAHTHLELSGCSAGAPPASFVDWVLSLPQRISAGSGGSDDPVTSAVRQGVEQCLRFGVTRIGDISLQFDRTRAILRNGPLKTVSYGETLGIGRRRNRFEQKLLSSIDRSSESPHLRVGLSPHAPYSVDRAGFEKCVHLARSLNMPLATHLAELPFEEDFLRHHAGELRRLLEALQAWDESIVTLPASPVRFAQSIGLLDIPALLAHVNYCDDAEIDLLARGRASVVYCPRTHAWFGHRPHRWRQMLQAGINVAVGTDSCASSPDLDPVKELCLLRRLAPDLPPLEIWRMASERAALAIGQAEQAGRLAPGMAADFAVFPSTASDPLAGLLDEPALPSQVWIDGQRVR